MKRVSERTPRGTAWWLLLSVKEAPRKPPLVLVDVKTTLEGTLRRSGEELIRNCPSVMVIVLSESVFIAAPASTALHLETLKIVKSDVRRRDL